MTRMTQSVTSLKDFDASLARARAEIGGAIRKRA
jgi:hypothetical protein